MFPNFLFPMGPENVANPEEQNVAAPVVADTAAENLTDGAAVTPEKEPVEPEEEVNLDTPEGDEPEGGEGEEAEV